MKKRAHLFAQLCVATLLLISCVCVGVGGNLSQDSLKHLAQKLGSELYRITKAASGHHEAQEAFLRLGLSVEMMNPESTLRDIAANVSSVMRKKVAAVKRLVESAEEMTKSAVWIPKINISYYNAKEVDSNTSGFAPMEFVQDARFHYILDGVNLTASSVHVPTNIYNRSPVVLNGAYWSMQLDAIFRRNLQDDPSLKSQYFGSAEGFLRMYPGIKWTVSDPDLYDCRLTNWYIRASSSPKDLVIMVDISGSMTGIREEIARTTVKEIMHTLHHDDFFNIIKIKEEAQFLDNCSYGTLVQATEMTKRRYGQLLNVLDTENIANYTEAFTMAFITLNSSHRSHAAECNKAIMVISDGAPENFDQVLQTLNPEKRVRIFTYVIGREVTSYNEMIHIACKNRGFVTHISTMADVRDNVEGYTRVLGRPMVLSTSHTNVWTNAYWHVRTCISVFARPVGIHTAGGYSEETVSWSNDRFRARLWNMVGMVLTVAQPVFNRSSSALRTGSLIGVVGIDVPISDIKKLMIPYRWGVGSYIFGTNHNGHLLFHPYWRLSSKNTTLPRYSYNEIDLGQVEFPLDVNFTETLERIYSLPLRREMVDQKFGTIRMNVMRHLDERRRLYIREYAYYYAGVPDTPLSIGVAVPLRMGRPNSEMLRVQGRSSLSQDEFALINLTSSQWKIHPEWSYCNVTVTPEQIFSPETHTSEKSEHENSHSCDEQLVSSLALDIKASQAVVTHWTRPDIDALHQTYQIETAFVITRAGLTRWKDLQLRPQEEDNNLPEEQLPQIHNIRVRDEDGAVQELETEEGESVLEGSSAENITAPEDLDLRHFFEHHPKAVDESFYERTVTSDNEMTITISPTTGGMVIDHNESSFMASVPVFIGDGAQKTSPAAITGVFIKTRRLKRLISDLSYQTCKEKQHCLSCHDPSIGCLLVDESGYVVVSMRNDDDRRKFFGELYGQVMEKLVENGIFKQFTLHDYQGICQPVKSVRSKNACGILRPLSWLLHVLEGVKTLTGQIVLFAGNAVWSVASESVGNYKYHADGGEADDADSEDYSSEDGNSTAPSAAEEEAVVQAAPHLCDMEYSLFHSEWTQLQASFTLSCQANCTKNVGVFKVSTTNLLLIAMDKMSACRCNENPIKTSPKEIILTAAQNCSKYTSLPYRKRPTDCFPFHPDEDSSDCRASSCVSLNNLLLLFPLLAILYLH